MSFFALLELVGPERVREFPYVKCTLVGFYKRWSIHWLLFTKVLIKSDFFSGNESILALGEGQNTRIWRNLFFLLQESVSIEFIDRSWNLRVESCKVCISFLEKFSLLLWSGNQCLLLDVEIIMFIVWIYWVAIKDNEGQSLLEYICEMFENILHYGACG